jgi:glyoxylase-like metal-dependent hydrolase (beta-lactamase superfamily II)
MRPAELPLPGGREGATVRLHPLLAGELLAPPGLLAKPPGVLGGLKAIGLGVAREDRIWIPVPAFLVEHPSAGPVVIDTGFHPSVAEDPKISMGPMGARLYTYRLTAAQAVDAQLRERGVDPADVQFVLMTHLHWDHASGVSQLAASAFVFDEREWAPAHRRTGFMQGYRAAQLEPADDWRSVDQSAGVAHGPFERTLDVFGDGSVRLVSTPGHSVGHQSVLLRLGGGEVLVAGDAAYTLHNVHDGVDPGIWVDGNAWHRSVAQIREFAQDGSLVICGHDPEQWPTLDAAYE